MSEFLDFMTDWTFKGFFDKILLKGCLFMVKSANKKAYDMKYNKERTKQKIIRFFIATDKDILDYLDNMSEPFGTYVKRLIRDDIKKSE